MNSNCNKVVLKVSKCKNCGKEYRNEIIQTLKCGHSLCKSCIFKLFKVDISIWNSEDQFFNIYSNQEFLDNYLKENNLDYSFCCVKENKKKENKLTEKIKNCDNCNLDIPSKKCNCSHEFCSKCIIDLVFEEIKFKLKDKFVKESYKNFEHFKKEIKFIKCKICCKNKKKDYGFYIIELIDIINSYFISSSNIKSKNEKNFIKENHDENKINCKNCQKQFLLDNLNIVQFSCAHIYCSDCLEKRLTEIINHQSNKYYKKIQPQIKIDLIKEYNPNKIRIQFKTKNIKEINCPECKSNGKYSIEEAICFMNKVKGVKECKYCFSPNIIKLKHNCEVCKECQINTIYKQNGDLNIRTIFKFKNSENFEFMSNRCINCSKDIIDYTEKGLLFTDQELTHEIEQHYKFN